VFKSCSDSISALSTTWVVDAGVGFGTGFGPSSKTISTATKRMNRPSSVIVLAIVTLTINCHFLARYLSPLSRCSIKDSLEASDAIELSGLCDTERSRALTRFEIIRPFLEDGVPLTRLAKEQQIVLRTALRWVERYRKSGLAGLVRKERNDKDERRLLPELQEIIEGLALSRPKTSRTC
jgi:hypothetical protein